jgi:hypothetical protein
MPVAGNFRKMYAVLLTDPDSAASSNGYTFTLRKNGVATAATVTILSSTSSFEASYAGADVHFAAGDLVDYEQDVVGSPANAPLASFIIEFQSDSGGGYYKTILTSGIKGASLTATGAQFLSAFGQLAQNATEGNTYTVVPMAGTITSFSSQLTTVPGTSNSRTFTIRQTSGGSTSSVGTAITYSAAQNGVHTQTQSISVAAGDLIDYQEDVTGTPATSKAGFSLVFEPTTGGQFIIPSSYPLGSILSASATRYVGLSVGAGAVETTEANAKQVVTADFSLNGWTAWLDVSPGGSGKTYTVDLRRNAGAPSVTYSTGITAGGVTSSASTSYSIVANWDLLDTRVVPSSTPTAAHMVISYVGYIAP